MADPQPERIIQISVDINNPADLKKTISSLTRRRREVLKSLGFVGSTFAGSKFNMTNIYPEFEKMLDTDLSTIYPNEGAADFYVYAHCDPTQPLNVNASIKHVLLASRFGLSHEPFYIGKGRGGRSEDLNRSEGHRKIRTRLLRCGKDIEVRRLAVSLTEGQALALESKLIDLLGLKCLHREGMLVNLDEGKHANFRRTMYSKKIQVLLEKHGFETSSAAVA